MDTEYLAEYRQREIDSCRTLFADAEFKSAPVKGRLRRLLSAPLDRDIVYCETGGMDNLVSYPADKSIVLKVFPYKSQKLFEKSLGPLGKFIEQSEEKRIIPIVQDPRYYVGLDYLSPLFERIKAPCYFSRGNFAYATIMGDDSADLEESEFGVLSLRSLVEFQNKCSSKHAKWLEHALTDENCWERAYRRIGPFPKNMSGRHKESLTYRYASVAYCLGEDVTDEIISTFDHVLAAKILLHLHILFDHVIANGFGSNFSTYENSDQGIDLFGSAPKLWTGISKCLCPDLMLPVPAEGDDYMDELLKYEHPLQGIRLDELEGSKFEEISMRIAARFARLRKKLENREQPTKKQLISLSLVGAGAIVGTTLDAKVGLGLGALGVTGLMKELPDLLHKAFERLYKRNLAFFVLKSRWE